MGRRLITSASEAASGGGGYTLCNDLCVTSVKADTFTNNTTGCKLAQWELIDMCEAFVQTTQGVAFDYTADLFSAKYDLICFYIAHPVSNNCTVTCLHLRFNGTNLVGTTGCNSTCAYYTTCNACANVCQMCTHNMEGYNCSPNFYMNTYTGVLFPHFNQVNSSNAAGDCLITVGYDFRKSSSPGWYWRGEGINRGMVFCGCHSAGWTTLSGMFICQNCAPNSSYIGRYSFYGRKCLALE